MLWSDVMISGKPTFLVIDASQNAEGWEAGFCDRFVSSMKRRKLQLKQPAPVRVGEPEELLPHLEPQDSYNALVLFVHGHESPDAKATDLCKFWKWLNTALQLGPKLFIVCTWEAHDPETSQAILKSSESFAQMALVPLSPLSQREAKTFFLKFCDELDAHSTDSITGRMTWFSHAKASDLLRQRGLTGKVGARC